MTGPSQGSSGQGSGQPFCDDPHIDRLLSMIVALGAEVSVLSEQLDTLRRLLIDRGTLDAASIADYAPPAEAQAERERVRRKRIASLLSSLDTGSGTPAQK
jgi:hypothetical protein